MRNRDEKDEALTIKFSLKRQKSNNTYFVSSQTKSTFLSSYTSQNNL